MVRQRPADRNLSDPIITSAFAAAQTAVQQIFSAQGTIGLSVGVVVDQEMVWHRGFGKWGAGASAARRECV